MTLNGDNWEATYDFSDGNYFTFATNDICVSTQAVLTNYNATTIAGTDKCYTNGWIYFRDPIDVSKYIAAIYDPNGLIETKQKSQTRIAADASLTASWQR